MPIKILSLDYLIADMVVELEGNNRLSDLVEKYKMIPGGKKKIDDAGLHEFSNAVAGKSVVVSPGGSAANTLWTVGKVMGVGTEISFIGVKGGGSYSAMISDSLKSAGVKLLPESFSNEQMIVPPESSISFVVRFPDGSRSIATHGGSARDLIVPEIITESLVENTDIVFFQGSLYRKFNKEVPDRLLGLAKKFKKEVIFALPTHMISIENNRDMLQQRIEEYADILLGNEEELMAVYDKMTIEDALGELKATIDSSTNLKVAYITAGVQGVMIVSKDDIVKIPSLLIDPSDIINTLGAGDTAFAGFIIGELCNMSAEDAARVGLILARNNLMSLEARAPHPDKAIESEAADLWAVVK